MNLDSIEGVERELSQLRRKKFEENLAHMSDEELLAVARSYASCGEKSLKISCKVNIAQRFVITISNRMAMINYTKECLVVSNMGVFWMAPFLILCGQ